MLITNSDQSHKSGGKTNHTTGREKTDLWTYIIKEVESGT
jgi:hypothetical protein